MVREKSDKIDDGADESMLAGEEKTQLARKDEVKFIPADPTANGEAKIDIGFIDKVSAYCNILYLVYGEWRHRNCCDGVLIIIAIIERYYSSNVMLYLPVFKASHSQSTCSLHLKSFNYFLNDKTEYRIAMGVSSASTIQNYFDIDFIFPFLFPYLFDRVSLV